MHCVDRMEYICTKYIVTLFESQQLFSAIYDKPSMNLLVRVTSVAGIFLCQVTEKGVDAIF